MKLLFIPFFLLAPISLFADNITIVADEWCPYNCDPKSKNPGFMIEIANEAFSTSGHNVVYRTMNWARAISDTRRGTFNAIVGTYKSDAPDFIFPKNELGISQDCFYANKNSSWYYSDINSLRNVTVGVINGYSYGKLLDEYFTTSKKVSVVSGINPFERSLIMLADNRIDTFIDSRYVFEYKIAHDRVRKNSFKKVGCVKNRQNVYIAFSPKNKKSAEYSRILSKKIEALRRSGKLQNILSKYGLTDWTKVSVQRKNK